MRTDLGCEAMLETGSRQKATAAISPKTSCETRAGFKDSVFSCRRKTRRHKADYDRQV